MFCKVPLVRAASFGAALLLILSSCSEIITTSEDLQVAPPSFSLAAGVYSSPQTIALSTVTRGAQIFYTTQGDVPTPTTGTLYTAPFVLSSTATVRAVATKTGWASSPLVSRVFTITLPQPVADPVISPDGGSFAAPQTITLSTSTPGASLRYTLNGLEPSEFSMPYFGPFVINGSATVKVIAIKSGMANSQVVSRDFTITIPQPVADPVISPDGGSFTAPQTISLSTSTPGASLRYTLNGMEPNEFSSPYFGPFVINGSATVKVIAIKSGMANSQVVSRDFTITIPQPVADPVISPDGGSFTAVTTVSLASATDGAEIYYTLDNTDPSATHGTLYTGAFLLTSTKTVKAIAVKAGMADSQVLTRVFTITLGSGGISVTFQ